MLIPFQNVTVGNQLMGRRNGLKGVRIPAIALLNEDFRLKSTSLTSTSLRYCIVSLFSKVSFALLLEVLLPIINYLMLKKRMKKIYMLALPLAFMAVVNSASAQFLIDFEDLTVPGADTAWLGADQSGGFTSNGVDFENTYTVSEWGNYWSGFIYSNSTNVTTAGSSNAHSAYAGSGANNSENYVVNFASRIDFGSANIISSIDITNTTYAALSMLNGDAFGKQFGSVNNADGDPDGTNGEDWFKLTIIGRNIDSVLTDSVEFYLADYRFADNADDYIVNTWETVYLHELGIIRYLEFKLESSDVSGIYINTPAYFALDNLAMVNLGEEELNKSAYSVYPNPASTEITFKGLIGEVSIFNTVGQLVATEKVDGKSTLDISSLATGTYTYKVIDASGVAVGQFVKN